MARRLGPYPADVADVVQETFLAAARTVRISTVRKAHSGTGSTALRATMWHSTTGRNSDRRESSRQLRH